MRAPRKKRRGPGSEAALYELALRYLDRFPCSRQRLRQHLGKKLAPQIAEGTTEEGTADAWITGVCDRLERARILDDAAYAESRARVMHRRGKPIRLIRRDLVGKGISEAHIDEALTQLAGAGVPPDLAAAARHARKRRLGPFSTKTRGFEQRRKELAAMGRAGFSFDVASRVIDEDDVEVIEAWAL